jgi:hypothetical protein
LFISDLREKLRLTKISVDRANGEEVLLETPTGFVDLNDREEIEQLTPGWYQFVVLSDPIRKSDGTINTNTAIYKAINLKSRGGKFVLPASSHPNGSSLDGSFSHVFTRQTAFLEPMLSIPYRMLTTGIRKTDHTTFAIKPAEEDPVTSSDKIVINFDPQEVEDLMYFPPDITGAGLPLDREDFELEYAYIPSGTTSLTGLILRATLERTPELTEAATPILRSYSLRVSY